MHRLKEAGKSLIILSNSSRRAETTQQNMGRMEIDHTLFDRDRNIGRGSLASDPETDRTISIENLGVVASFFNGVKDDSFFEALDLEPVDDIEAAEFILLNGTEKDKFPSYEPILRRAVERGLPMVCANGDFVSITPEGELVQCPGCLHVDTKRLAALSDGTESRRPAPMISRSDADQDRARVLAIGDSPAPRHRRRRIERRRPSLYYQGIHRPELAESGN